MRIFRTFLPILLLSCGTAFADPTPPDSGLQVVLQWVMKKANSTTLAEKKPVQTQSISIDHGSTTFVDQSSGADLVSGALNLAGLGGGSTGGTGSGTVSASLYSLYALGLHADPLTPTFYDSHEALRQLFFTVGREQEKQGTTTLNPADLGTVVGVKWLLINRRDASSIMKDTTANDAIAKVATDYANTDLQYALRVLGALTNGMDAKSRNDYERNLTIAIVDEDVSKLPKDAYTNVQSAVSDYAKKSAGNQAALDALVQHLQQRTQFSISFQTTQRGTGQNDDYQGELILDRGFGQNFFMTLNGSYDYSASSKIGGDVRSGRAAAELRWYLAKPPASSLKKPLELALSGEGVLKSSIWQYRAQLQLSIPLATGVDLPVSFGYGNDPALLQQQEKSVYGKFGITFDLQKVAGLLTGSK